MSAISGQSLAPTALRSHRSDGTPVYALTLPPGAPLHVVRFDHDPLRQPARAHPHAHDFLTLAYFDEGAGSVLVDGRPYQVRAGHLLIVAPGEVVAAREGSLAGWNVLFPPEVLGASLAGAFLAWRAHPLLFPYVRGTAGGVRRLTVAPQDRARWGGRVADLDAELREGREGYRESALALLTLLLVDVGRLAAAAADPTLLADPLLARVFGVVEDRHTGDLSLREVAAAVGVTPAHLTTVVRRKTGRTVVEWITERRMSAARRLLADPGLSVEEVARAVGYRDPAYFTRLFRRHHGQPPSRWRA